MSRERELLLQAWKELLDAYEGSNGERIAKEINAYLAAEKQDQSEPVQDEEPVGTLDHNGNFELLRMVGIPISQPMKLFEHPAPQRSFVRLSDEEICIVMDNVLEGGGWIDVARAIEDALEEKNR